MLLLNDMNDDLSRIYRLFSRVPEGLVPVSEIFKSHLIDLGNEKVDQRLARAEKGNVLLYFVFVVFCVCMRV